MTYLKVVVKSKQPDLRHPGKVNTLIYIYIYTHTHTHTHYKVLDVCLNARYVQPFFVRKVHTHKTHDRVVMRA
jgi:hypothetical protein